VIPLGDSVGGRRQAVTLGIVVACALVFLYELTLRGAALDAFVQQWGAVPRRVLPALAGDPRVPREALVTLFTSQFIHAGFLHLGGNMLFLWVFGRAIEDRVGPAVYLAFYLLAGAVAGLVQSFFSAGENVPLIGASGAIAGILGMYFIAYPTAWVRVLMPVLFFFWTFDLPAVLVLAFWFVSQFFSGMAAITHASRATGDVAVWAHVAGFVLGAASAALLPHSSSGLPQGAGSPAVRRSDAPGPARLISSLADLAALLLVARLLLRFFALAVARSPLAVVTAPILAVTEPVVAPFQEFLPSVRVLGGVLETYTLIAILAVYVLAGLLGQLFLKK
jgi:membrane associated rhomboid family serine protease